MTATGMAGRTSVSAASRHACGEAGELAPDGGQVGEAEQVAGRDAQVLGALPPSERPRAVLVLGQEPVEAPANVVDHVLALESGSFGHDIEERGVVHEPRSTSDRDAHVTAIRPARAISSSASRGASVGWASRMRVEPGARLSRIGRRVDRGDHGRIVECHRSAASGGCRRRRWRRAASRPSGSTSRRRILDVDAPAAPRRGPARPRRRRSRRQRGAHPRRLRAGRSGRVRPRRVSRARDHGLPAGRPAPAPRRSSPQAVEALDKLAARTGRAAAVIGLPRSGSRPLQRRRGVRARACARRLPQAPAAQLRGVRRAALLRAVTVDGPAVRRGRGARRRLDLRGRVEPDRADRSRRLPAARSSS